MLRLLAAGNWTPSQVHVRIVACSRLVIPEVEAIIEREWSQNDRTGTVLLFDGTMARWESWEAGPQALRLVLSETRYKPFLGTNLRHPELADRFGRNVLANPVGVSPALLTADNFLMLGRRNASVAYYPERTHPFAGAMEPRDGPDVFAAVRRELEEELSLTAEDIAEIRCTGIVEDRALRQPELIFFVRSPRTRTEIEAQVDRDEHHTSFSLPATRAAVREAVADSMLTPVAVASLLLWGRLQFGAQWFQAMLARLEIPEGYSL
jgi:8-oxo-dGTP pyrophosphatase MutT (NUDIX family)